MTPEQRETLEAMVERGGTQCGRMCGDFEPHEMDALRAALATPPTYGTWQPIETAPKDGTPILVADAKSVEMGVWQEATDDETESGVVIMPGFEAGWWGSDWQPGASQPSHWMPLPAAPTEPTR